MGIDCDSCLVFGKQLSRFDIEKVLSKISGESFEDEHYSDFKSIRERFPCLSVECASPYYDAPIDDLYFYVRLGKWKEVYYIDQLLNLRNNPQIQKEYFEFLEMAEICRQEPKVFSLPNVL